MTEIGSIFCAYKRAWNYAGMTMGEIGAASGGADYAAVGMALRRLNRKLKQDKAVAGEWLRVKEKLENRLQKL